jgi:hypothetical protein
MVESETITYRFFAGGDVGQLSWLETSESLEGSSQYLLRMLFVEVSVEVIRPRKSLAATRKVAG